MKRFFYALPVAALAIAFACGAGGPSAPVYAQPKLTPPTPDPTPDPNKSLPPLPDFSSTYTAPPKDPYSYDDDAMHFRPPDSYLRVTLAGDTAATEDLKPVAVYTQQKAKGVDAGVIIISVKTYTGDLNQFEAEREQDTRNSGSSGSGGGSANDPTGSQSSDTVFIGFHRRITLVNGMPAYFLKIDRTSGTSAQSASHYEYLVVDGERGIVVSYSSVGGAPDEKTAQSALASLTVVRYPHRRR